jgi:hypothetical protein
VNQMTSQTLEITKTHTLEEIFAGGDNALALGSEEECALALAFKETVSNSYQHDQSMIFAFSTISKFTLYTHGTSNLMTTLDSQTRRNYL